jgi:hypothetical protein
MTNNANSAARVTDGLIITNKFEATATGWAVNVRKRTITFELYWSLTMRTSNLHDVIPELQALQQRSERNGHAQKLSKVKLPAVHAIQDALNTGTVCQRVVEY